MRKDLRLFRYQNLFVFLLLLFVVAFARVHLRIQTTLVGYDIGKLKAQEKQLLDERSNLQMELATLTTKRNLMFLANTSPSPVKDKTIAAN